MNKQLIFDTTLKVNYSNEFILPTQNFIKNLIEIAGANEKEAFHLYLAIEETMSFIIERFPDDKFENYIELKLNVFEDNLIIIEINNFGPPIHANKIPEFNFSQANNDEGLWFKMVKSLVDEVEFVNNNNKGWQIKLQKHIQQLHFERPIHHKEETVDLRNLILRKAQADDAPALVDLTYYTYRYTIGFSDNYDTEKLKQAISTGKYHFFVVENDKRIIAATAIKYSDNNRSAELGSGMVMPEYRKSTAIMRIMRECSNYHKTNPLQIEFFETFLVTTHALSQRAVTKVGNGYKPMSVWLNIMPRPDFIGIKNQQGTRETLLNACHLNEALKLKTIYTSETNREILHQLIQNTENEIKISVDTKNIEAEETSFSYSKKETIRAATLQIESIGKHWFSDIRKELFKLKSEGFEALFVCIPSDNPLPENMDNQLETLNLIFIGLSIQGASDAKLTYALINEPVNFNEIELFDPIAQKLLEHIRFQYEKILIKKVCEISDK